MRPRVVLASASPRRAAILRRMGLDFDVRPTHVDESYLPGESPAEHVERLAREKARVGSTGSTGSAGSTASSGGSVAPGATPKRGPTDAPETLVVAGDTVVVLDGRVLGKPADAGEAVGMLLTLADREHHVLTGVAVAGRSGLHSGVERTSVRFRAFTEAEARQYVATGEPMDKAGAYGIQGRGAALVAGIAGDYDAVVGLPVGRLVDLLARAGWRYTFAGLEPVSGGAADVNPPPTAPPGPGAGPP